MDRFEPESFLDAAAAALALPIAPEHRAGVILNLERLAAMAALVDLPLAPETEPLPVYRP